MIKTDVQLAADSLVIKNETIANANTALRVGALLVDLADSKINVSSAGGGLFAALSTSAWDFTTGTKRKITLAANTAITISGNVAGQSVAILSVTQDATGSRTLSIGGTAITINTAANSNTLVAVIDLGGGVFAFDTNIGVATGGVVTPPAGGVEAVVWADFANTAAGTNPGDLNGTNSTTPAGARATKKLATTGYVEFNIENNPSNALVLALDSVNDTNYTWANSHQFIATIYHNSGNIMKETNNGAFTGTVIGAVGTYKWLRLEKVGNDILYKASTDGTTYTTLSTDVGLVTGVANLFVKAVFAVNASTTQMRTVRGLLATI